MRPTILLILCLLIRSARGEGPIPIRLSPWPESSQRAAVSLTFDDAYRSHVERAMPMLERRGFRGTFYVIVDKLCKRGKYRFVPSAPLETWKEAAQRGHEIGSHTVSHVPLDSLDLSQMHRELYVSQFVLQVLFPGSPVFSLSYPFSRIDRNVASAARLLYTSGRLGSISPKGPPYNDPRRVNFLRLKSLFLCSRDSPLRWNAVVSQTIQAGGWLIETAHPIDERGYCGIRSEDLARHLDYLQARRKEIWVAPVGTVVRRLRCWRDAWIRAVSVQSDSIRLRLHRPEEDFGWQVFASVDTPKAWRLLDDRGREYPVRAEGGKLCFLWPARADTFLVLVRGERSEASPSSDERGTKD